MKNLRLMLLKSMGMMILFIICVSKSYSQYQVRWVVPDKIVNISLANPTTTALPTVSNCPVANGLFNAAGTLIFYATDYNIYNSSGAIISSFVQGTIWSEINICRVPTTPDKYYVIYSQSLPQNWTKLYYTMIQVTGTTPSVVAGQQNIFFNSGHLYWNNSSFAVSGDLDINNGANNKRYLYAAAGSGVDKYTVGSSGITFTQTIYSTINVNSINSVLELSHDGTRLAYGNPSSQGTLNVISLDACGNFSSISQYTIPINPINGVEFTEDGSKIYVGAGLGPNSGNIYKVVSGVVSLVSNTAGYGGSDIELAYNGKMYAAKSNGLGELNTLTDAFTQNKVLFNIIGCSPNYFTLPDQVDFNYGIAGKNGGWGPCCGSVPVLGISTNFGGCTYEWAPAGGLSCTNCPNPTATPSMSTTYTLTRTCGACVDIDKVLVTKNPPCCKLSESTDNEDATIEISPNPNTGIFSVSGLADGDLISIYNSLGEKAVDQVYSDGNKNNAFDLTSQPPGIYIVKISRNDRTIVKKILKQ